MLTLYEWENAEDLPDGLTDLYLDPKDKCFYTVRISTDHANQCYWKRPCRKIGRLVGPLRYPYRYEGTYYCYATVELAGGRIEDATLWAPKAHKGNVWNRPFKLEAQPEWSGWGPHYRHTGRMWVYGFDRTDFARAYDEPFFGYAGRVVYTDVGPLKMLGHKVAVPL